MSTVDFTDMEMDLNAPPVMKAPLTVDQSIEKWNEKGSASKQGAIYEETCTDCRGTGRFVSWAGRTIGNCFKCKGTGKMKFRTSPEQRAKQRESAAKLKMKKEVEKLEVKKLWIEENKAVVDFIQANRTWSEFYRSMDESIAQYGHLTANQLAAVERGMVKQAERAAERAKVVEAAPVVNALVQAFAVAISNGLKKPKLTLWDLQLSLAPATGMNAGCIYIKHQGEYVGKVLPDGRFLPTHSCPQVATDLVAKLGADVLEQAIASGKETGTCSCCGRHLENELSVELGIGPICRGKWGL